VIEEVLWLLAKFAAVFLAIVVVVGFVAYWKLRVMEPVEMPEITEDEFNGREFRLNDL
jgi:hypothetical protein